MATGEVYVQLAVNYADNRKMRALARYGREARAIRDLYVQMVCYCKQNLSDGFVPADQIGILVYPDTEKAGQRDAGRLAAAELVRQVDGGWSVTGYLDRNPSRAEVYRKAEAKAAGARMANHKRWHVEEGVTVPWCSLCQTSDQTTDPSSDQTSDQDAESDRISADRDTDSTETESKTQSKTETVASDDARREFEPGSDDDPDFCAFWDAYPRKIGKGQARKSWKTATGKRKADPKDIIAAAERWRDECRRKQTDRDFIPHPSTWLNGERYDESADDGDSGISYDPWEEAWRN